MPFTQEQLEVVGRHALDRYTHYYGMAVHRPPWLGGGVSSWESQEAARRARNDAETARTLRQNAVATAWLLGAIVVAVLAMTGVL